MAEAPKPIGREEYAKRIADLCARSGRHPFPRKARDRAILLHALARRLASNASAQSARPERFGADLCDEPEITKRIASWLLGPGSSLEVDPVSLRRALVDDGFFTREAGGTDYSASDAYEARFPFDPDVLDVDPDEVIAGAQAKAAERKQKSQEP